MPNQVVTADLEDIMVTVRPRLVRFASVQGIAVDAIDDVVQETLLEAWRHLDHLYSLEHYEAWLHGICRNICRRWMKERGVQTQSTLPLGVLQESSSFDIADPLPLDPVEVLDFQDLQILLDRALGYLSNENRLLVEQYYLAEMSQREIALRLGLTIHALESRLYRARRQLQQILLQELRAEAKEFGLTLADEALVGWHQAREWCWDCGQHRLYGLYKPMPDGRINFVMRCPQCGQCFDTEGCVSLDGVRSLRPARKRVLQAFRTFASSYRDGWSVCLHCKERKPGRLMSLEEYATLCCPNFVPSENQKANLFVVVECDTCAIRMMTNACVHVYTDPAVQQFRKRYPHAVALPHAFTEYVGLPAIRQTFADLASSAQLDVFVHRETLCLLALFRE